MKNEDYNIRFALKKDIDSIVLLMRSGFPYIIDKIIYGCSGINNYVEDNLSNSVYAYMVVTLKDKVEGAIEYRIADTVVILNYIVLGESLRGRGYANDILERSLNLLPRKDRFVLDVFMTNKIAINWYLKQGFKETGTTVWNEIFLSRTHVNEKYEVCNYLKNNDKYVRYGFSFFEFQDDNQCYSVGIMGKNWIRITDLELLCQIEPLEFIKKKFPERGFFMIADQGFKCDNPHIKFKNIVSCKRMEK
ncbi:GNAT family N-acetyltransferase [Phocaeicola sp.]